MGATAFFVLAAIVPYTLACNGAAAGPSYSDGNKHSALVYNVTKTSTVNGVSICDLNSCHSIKWTIDKVLVTSNGGTVQCLVGGPGDFKFRFKLTGPTGKTTNIQVWATWNETAFQLSRRRVGCLAENLYSGACA